MCRPHLLWLLALLVAAAPPSSRAQDGYRVRLSDLDSPEPDAGWPAFITDDDLSGTADPRIRTASFQEQPLLVSPRAGAAATELPRAAAQLQADLFGGGSLLPRSLLAGDRRTHATAVGADWVGMQESLVRAATDAGNLMGKSPASLGLGVQQRNPIISEPRVRGGRIGRLPASGSYWVPARMDLDTMLSKIDSGIIGDIITVKGPYAAQYGPGFSHVDFELLPSPRYADGFEAHGSTGVDFKTNGEQWYGRQRVWGGAADWGFRAGYGHRTGNDYTSGNGLGIPSSYNSRDVNVALGYDGWTDRSVEVRYLRLDQTGVELPGQAFDIDVLGTDGYEVRYVARDQPYCDRLTLDAWYNRTAFTGSAQRPGKRRQFPFYDLLSFVGFTDVDSLSTGFRLATAWGCADCEQLTAGVDFRYLNQELNEITSGGTAVVFPPWDHANSPIPRSYAANPGLFVEYGAPWMDCVRVTAGARVDLAVTDVIDDPAKLSSLGTLSTPANPISLADILGSGQFDRTYALWAAYLTGRYNINDCWTADVAVGYAERPPTLTELYVAQSFMFVLQNGLNTLTGNPQLDRERLCQIDLGLRYDDGVLRGRIGGFHAWAWDYITFENIGIVYDPSAAGQVAQVQLKYVNTDLATFTGAEAYGEGDLTGWLTPFATLSYVEGRDHTRNGDFATKPAAPGSPSIADPNFSRGAYSTVGGSPQEPLPGIVPWESRLGFRLHPAADRTRWSVELAARLVARQDRVATSLLESPSPGFTVWDVRGYWRPIDRLLLVAGVENFTNRAYREHLDFRSPSGIQMFQPGRNFYTGCEWSY